MNRIVTFSREGARIAYSDALPSSNQLVNPVLPRGIPPHLWILKAGKIATITQQEYDTANPVSIISVPSKYSKKSIIDYCILSAVSINIILDLIILFRHYR